MAKPDRWSQKLLCPDCGKTGIANMSDDPGPLIQADYNARVDLLPDGFKTLKRASRAGSVDIACMCSERSAIQ